MITPRTIGTWATLLVLLPAGLHARQFAPVVVQQPTAPTTALIVGRVVDAADGKPIARALVTLAGPVRIDQKDNPILTDPQGRFVFANLPPGLFTIAATADGYRPTETFAGHRVALQPDQKTGDISIALARTAALSGAVTDVNGEPLAGVLVRVGAHSAASPAMNERLSPANSVSRTDDRGVYRFANLPAGDYLVVVPSSVTTMPVAIAEAGQAARAAGEAASFDFNSELNRSNAPNPSTNGIRRGDVYLQTSSLPAYETSGGLFVRPTTYFDGAATPSTAVVVRVKAGDERAGVDIRVPFVPGFTVEGSVDVPAGSPAHLGVTLLPSGWAASRKGGSYEPYMGDAEIAKTVTTADGRFRFLGVPLGDYDIRILRTAGQGGMGRPPSLGPMPDEEIVRLNRQPTLYALVPVAVADRNVTGLSVNVRVGPHVSGRVEFIGSGPRPGQEPAQRPPAFGRQPFSVRLDVPIGTGISPGLRPAPIDADGRFTTMSMAPGRYFIAAESPGPGWTLASAMTNGRDISRLPLDLTSDVTDVVVTFVETASGRLTGVVHDARRSPDTDAVVYAFPSDYQALADAGSGALSRVLRQARPDARGAYSLSLAPGSYLIVALQTDGRQLDAAAIAGRVAAIATRVTLAKSATQTLDLVTTTVTAR